MSSVTYSAIYREMSETFIYSFSSIIYSWVTNDISTKKKFGPTKYLSEKISGPQNTHEKKIRSHEGTMARDPLDPQRDESHGI